MDLVFLPPLCNLLYPGREPLSGPACVAIFLIMDRPIEVSEDNAEACTAMSEIATVAGGRWVGADLDC